MIENGEAGFNEYLTYTRSLPLMFVSTVIDGLGSVFYNFKNFLQGLTLK